MRILYICFNKVGHGTYLRAYEFARCLVSQNHSVTLMAVSQDQRVGLHIRDENGIKIVATPDMFSGSLRSGWDPVNVISRINWLKNKTFDLVHAFEARPVCFYPALYMQKRGVPTLFDWSDWLGCGGSVEQRRNPILRICLRPVESFYENRSRTKADANSVICSTLHNKALALGVDPDHLSLIPNGFDIPGWKTYSKEGVRRLLDLEEKSFLVGYIGSLFPDDAELMAEAFQLLTELVPSSRLLHIGRSNYFSAKIPAIISTGDIEQVKLNQYLSACDVCWLPFKDINANRGRFPLKFSYYLAAGKPIIATDVGDVSEYVHKERVGVVCPPTPKGLASGVFHLHENPELIQEYAMGAKRLTKEPQHTWLLRTENLMRLYQKIL